jgi:hypothetical protein
MFRSRYHHDTLMKAYDYLLDRRPVCSPNSGFLIQLIRYEKALRNSGAIDEQQSNSRWSRKEKKTLSNFSFSKTSDKLSTMLAIAVLKKILLL